MRKLLTTAILFTAISLQAQKLEKIWETAPVLATPESVLPVPEKGLLYISLINGGPWEADGKGGVARLKDNGTGYDSTWVTGLHAPKGMGLWKDHLYVADMGEVVVIDVRKGKIEKRIAIEGAQGLNDVTVSDDGVVYVSDSRTAKVWRLEKSKPVLFLENMQGVNGLKAVGDDVLVAAGKTFLKASAAGVTTKIAELPQGGDGIEPLGDGSYLVTSWAGYIFHVAANGAVKTLLETHADKLNAADIGYDAAKRTVYVPTFFARTVAAYKLN